MNKKIIVEVPFNRRGERYDHNELNKDWIKYRLDIFKKYSVPSLVNQTNQYFTVLLEVRDVTLGYILRKCRNLPENIIIVGDNLKVTIRRLIEHYHTVYFTRLDSDDCFDKDYIDLLHNYSHKPDTDMLISQYCYNYDIHNHRLMKFFLPSPQSYTRVFKVEDYCKGKQIKPPGGHNGAILLKHELIKGYNYLDTVHDKNISSLYWEKSKGRLQLLGEVENKTEILKRFGIDV